MESLQLSGQTHASSVTCGDGRADAAQNVVERLGLEPLRTSIVTYADERREERRVAGPVAFEVCDRFMVTECVVGSPPSEPLIGQIVLEGLDLIADCANQTLTPRTPDYPSLKLK